MNFKKTRIPRITKEEWLAIQAEKERVKREQREKEQIADEYNAENLDRAWIGRSSDKFTTSGHNINPPRPVGLRYALGWVFVWVVPFLGIAVLVRYLTSGL